ncbi:hypothetical protein FOA43_004168 [Brettanomyces nanus]|uniref:Phospholipase C/D domain-containing protein n=1 Tax=Eeniella nana TaxID=13502 RepID=A0A875SDK5_EENNA|nr:uncharacterized protein FOA43_004168 [Brettanomyces nanus]QPG76774.1 hypothetical protein FOA43_004168 [Brettanomyces nanus]
MRGLLIFCILFQSVIGAGIAVHLTIAARINRYLPLEIQSRYSYYLAGAFYPDAFYGCLGNSDLAETAHWPKFLHSSVRHYWKNPDGNLKAFLYGVFTHQVADVSWHSLKSKQGLLDMIGSVEFDGDIKDGHTFLDTAGDFINLAKQLMNVDKTTADNIEAFFRIPWKYPAEDIIEIYSDLGKHKPLAKSEIEFCMLRGYAALQGEVTGSRASVTSRTLGYYIEKSPLTYDLLEEYFYGGLDEIMGTIRICIKELDNWFEGDLPDDPWTLCSVFQKKSIQNHESNVIKFQSLQVSSSNNGLFVRSNVPNSLFGHSLKVGKYLDDKLTLAIGSPLEDVAGAEYLIPLDDLFTDGVQHISSMTALSIHYNYTNMQFPPRFGYASSSWKLPSGLDLLCIAEPGTSTIHLYFQGQMIAIISDLKAKTELGVDGVKQLPLGLTAVDGDMLIYSFYSDGVARQSGIVFILSGSKLENKLSWPLRSTIRIDMSELNKREYHLPKSLLLPHDYEQMGTSAAVTKNAVLVGINCIGSVLIFDRLTGFYLGRLGGSKLPSKDTGSFGFNFILTGKFHGMEWVLVSSSSETQGSCINCGAAYLYVFRGFGLHKIVKIIPGTDKFQSYSRFGTSAVILDTERATVLISGEGYDGGKGAVWEVSIGQLLNSLSEPKDIVIADSIVVVGPGGVGYTGFGKSIDLFNYEDSTYLAVGMPRFGYNVLEESAQYCGCVGIYKMNN